MDMSLDNYYVNKIKSGEPRALRALSIVERRMSPFSKNLRDRIKNELMFPLDDFSEIISSRLVRHFRKLGASPQQIKEMRERSFPHF